MKRKPKMPKMAGIMRHVVALNVKGLMERVYKDEPNKPQKLADESGTGLGTIQRVIAGEVGATVDTLEAVSLALNVSTYQLFVAGLDPDAPQKVPGAEKAEQKIFVIARRGKPPEINP